MTSEDTMDWEDLVCATVICTACELVSVKIICSYES
jgi:hypothetical protein